MIGRFAQYLGGPTPDLPISEHHAATFAGEPAQVAHRAAGVSLDHLAKAGGSADVAFAHSSSLLAMFDGRLSPAFGLPGAWGRR